MTNSTSGPPATTASRSCLYECRVLHHRLSPKPHRFEYGLFLISLDLDEVSSLGRRLRLFSHNRKNLYEFRDRDHLEFPEPGRHSDLKTSLRRWLETQGVEVPADARFTLITLPRVAGYLFNPVSFCFVTTRDGNPVCAIAEVGNTFGELKPYLVRWTGEPAGPDQGRYRTVVPKRFYVSPFIGLDVSFDFNFQSPGDRLEIGINDIAPDGSTLLVSRLSGRRQPLTDGRLLWMTLRYPLVTLRVITLIHWQALRLWVKRLPWLRKSGSPELQTGLFRPHSSLAPLVGTPVPTALSTPRSPSL